VRHAFVATIAVAAALIAGSGAGAGSAACVYADAYPGDNASKDAIAAWMAGGATDAGLPGELPVMAALADAGLRNLPQGDRMTAGYFQMRVDIWNKGDYAGFPDHPTLQLQWFINQAQAVRQRAIAAGDIQYGQDPSTWGVWAADVQRPAEQYRGRYQPRLDDARSLMASGCTTAAQPMQPRSPDPSGAPSPDAQLIPDSTLPRIGVELRRYQDAAKTGRLSLKAACANERCLLRAAASIAVPSRAVYRVSAPPVQMERGRAATFRLVLGKRLRQSIAKSLRAHVCPLAVVRVVAANAGGYRNSMSRTVRAGLNAAACS
jgi:hypothetical protein